MSSESDDSGKRKKKIKRSKLVVQQDVDTSAIPSSVETEKQVKKKHKNVALEVPHSHEEKTGPIKPPPSDLSLSTIMVTSDTGDDDDLFPSHYLQEDEEEEQEGREARRARAKSVYLSCFAGVDSIYFVIRLVVFLRVDIYHDAGIQQGKISFNITDELEIDGEGGKYFCNDEELEAQCAWIFSVTWLCYFLANVSLILSIIWLSLKLCYAYVFMKTTSIIIHFLGILTYGYHCLSQKFYIETGVFFIIHLPLQIFGTKRTRNYALSLKRAALEKLTRTIMANASQLTTGTSKKERRKSVMALQRRRSFQVVTTVDE